MRHTLAWVVAGVFLAAPAIWLAPQVLAQDEASQQAAELTQLWDRIQKSNDREERISLAERALKLEPELRQWPLTTAREIARATLWASLGLDYADRRSGDRTENLERGVAALLEALPVLTRERSARNWATLQYTLGAVYVELSDIHGDPGDRLEKAFAAFEAALSVRTREAMPEEWAETQYRLGIAYFSRIRGGRADNLEKAIAAYEAALTVFTRDALPHKWADTQTTLGLAYFHRIRGDRSDNLEKAIAAYQGALTVSTHEARPHYWAAAQNNLGFAYERRIHGDVVENLEKAIAAYEAALTVSTREAAPRQWAETQANLGNAYQIRVHGDRGVNREKSIAANQAALTVLTREALPRLWAITQSNLGNAYRARFHGNRADNLEKAIAAYEAALTVQMREALPQEWATTQNNIGIAYVARAYEARIDSERADSLDKAIAAYKAASTVRTLDALPREHLRTSRDLGAALFQAREWHKAATAYASARDAFLLLFGQGLNDAEARSLISEAGPLFSEAAYAAAERGELDQALALSNEGKALQLRVALRQQAVELPADKRPEHAGLVAQLREWERLAETAKGAEAVAALDRVALLRKQLGDLIAPYLGKEAGLTHELIPEGGAIVAPIVTRFGGKLLLATAGSGGPSIGVISVPQLDSERLDTLMRGDGKSGGWLGAYKSQHLHARWLAAIESLGPELWGLFGAALDRGLHDRGIKAGARVVVLPTAALGLLPLGLARNPASGRRLAETYEMVQAPSFETLAAASARAGTTPAPSLAAAINPTGDLAFTEIEGALVAAHFAGRPQLKLDASVATPGLVLEALKGKSYWHFASHGEFDWNDVRRSGLVMREQEKLTIGRLLQNQGSLGRPRLVVLSACETGLYDISRNPDEFVGLPATFMQVGAAGVVGSLWLVDDLATSLLMARFYDLHIGGLTPPAALQKAQSWLREATREQLLAYVKTAGAKAKLDRTKLGELNTALTTRTRSAGSRFAAIWEALHATAEPAGRRKGNRATDMKARPFQHPYYWGGFVYTGL